MKELELTPIEIKRLAIFSIKHPKSNITLKEYLGTGIGYTLIASSDDENSEEITDFDSF